jgi:hypothetical protein
MRLMSFFLTTAQYLDGSKDVTRRLGWLNLQPGETVMGCKKSQGRRNGEPVVRLGAADIVSVRREPLRRMMDEPEYGAAECRREGFPNMTPAEFVAMFCKHMGCEPDRVVTRIEFRRVTT